VPRLRALQLLLLLSLCLVQQAPAVADAGNDRYAFSPAGSRQRGITLERSARGVKLVLTSAEIGNADTLLLGLRVAATGDRPLLRARAGALVIEQYLDAHAHGLRWFNLTSLRAALGKKTRVELEALDATVTSLQANLRMFENRLPFERGVLVLSPHPDDAEIAAFALYASHAQHVRVVTVTSGNAGTETYRAHFELASEQYQFKGMLRAIDSVTVPWLGGVRPEHCYNLGYFDGRLEEMQREPARVFNEMYGENRDVSLYRRANLGALLPVSARLNSWQNLVADLAQLFSSLNPGVVVMPHPLLDFHPDHQFLAVAAAEALREYANPVSFLLYTNHADNNLYPYGPAGSVVSLPPWTVSELPVQGLYALPVDRSLQRRKLFALDSMHDLRFSPEEQKNCSTQPPTVDSPRYESMDYFRRAPRSEELFFVFDRAGVSALVRRFLAERTAR
jgi:LmbE family N-acetylglucosaminyl deacetylase